LVWKDWMEFLWVWKKNYILPTYIVLIKLTKRKSERMQPPL
jgi:hypothetical protein